MKTSRRPAQRLPSTKRLERTGAAPAHDRRAAARALRVLHPLAAALERSSLLMPFHRALANAACCLLVTRFIRFLPPFRPIAAKYRRISLSSATRGSVHQL
jgi:hypothetical protein